MSACTKHAAEPVRGYSDCPGCEVESLRQQLAAAQAEARELRAELARVRGNRTEAELRQLKHDLETAGISAFMSPEKLPKEEWYSSAAFCRDVVRRARYVVEDMIAALSQPAAEQPAAPAPELPLMARRSWMRRDTDYFVVHGDFCLEIKALNGRAPHYDEDGELLVCAEAGDSIERDQVDAEAQPDGIYRIADTDEHSLPLMARRRWMPKAVRYCFRNRDCGWFFSLNTPTDGEWEFVFRIADTDEHGLPVIERTADMPEGAKYHLTWIMRADAAGGEVEYTDSLPLALEANRSGAVSERIEDYRPAAQESDQ